MALQRASQRAENAPYSPRAHTLHRRWIDYEQYARCPLGCRSTTQGPCSKTGAGPVAGRLSLVACQPHLTTTSSTSCHSSLCLIISPPSPAGWNISLPWLLPSLARRTRNFLSREAWGIGHAGPCRGSNCSRTRATKTNSQPQPLQPTNPTTVKDTKGSEGKA